MSSHLRANLWLLVLTVLLCSVLYPLVLLGIGQTVFHDKAQGSLLDAKGQPVSMRKTRSARGSSLSRSRPTSISNPGLRRHRTTLPPPALPIGRPTITCFATAWHASLAPS